MSCPQNWWLVYSKGIQNHCLGTKNGVWCVVDDYVENPHIRLGPGRGTGSGQGRGRVIGRVQEAPGWRLGTCWTPFPTSSPRPPHARRGPGRGTGSGRGRGRVIGRVQEAPWTGGLVPAGPRSRRALLGSPSRTPWTPVRVRA